MASTGEVAECGAAHLRPVARWVRDVDASGRSRLLMVWSVPDPDEALTVLVAAEA